MSYCTHGIHQCNLPYFSLNLPSNILDLAGAHTKKPVEVATANAIKNQYAAGNITATETLQVLNFVVQSVYHATPDKESNPYACEFNGLAELTCPDEPSSHQSPMPKGVPIRSVTLAGLFVDALWATNGVSLTLDQQMKWYTPDDFTQMAKLGLNTVQILVPTAAFIVGDVYGAQVKSALKDILLEVDVAGLKAILALVGTGDELDAVVAAARFASSRPTVLALTLPSHMTIDQKTLLDSIRVEAPKLPLFLPMGLGDLIENTRYYDSNVYASLDMSHANSIADIASSESQEDRSKLFYHESMACIARSPLEFAPCMKRLPVFVGAGFDLSIDDCVNQHILPDFKDYGQCNRFDETIDSGWWERHRASFAARQLYAYERGLGWSFAAWKLYSDPTAKPPAKHSFGVIDIPAKLMSLQDVADAGLFPSLDEKPIPAIDACLNPPENDFILGDATLAPTMGPPPDCGNGWWNYTTSKCDYWIPPPEPTPAPTVPCPVCDKCPEPVVQQEMVAPPAPSPSSTSSSLVPCTDNVISGSIGALIGALLGAILMRCFSRNRRSQEYQTIPN